MYVRPWWLELLKWLLAGLLLAGLGRWLNAIRLRPRPASQQGELPYPPGTLRLAALCTAFMSGLSAGCLFWPNDSVTWWVTTGFLLFTALSVHWLLDCLVARFIPDDRGLAYRSPFGRRGRLEWSAVVEVRYVAWAHWFGSAAAAGAPWGVRRDHARCSGGHRGGGSARRGLKKGGAETPVFFPSSRRMAALPGGRRC